jgi:hypothetical protein
MPQFRAIHLRFMSRICYEQITCQRQPYCVRAPYSAGCRFPRRSFTRPVQKAGHKAEGLVVATRQRGPTYSLVCPHWLALSRQTASFRFPLKDYASKLADWRSLVKFLKPTLHSDFWSVRFSATHFPHADGQRQHGEAHRGSEQEPRPKAKHHYQPRWMGTSGRRGCARRSWS